MSSTVLSNNREVSLNQAMAKVYGYMGLGLLLTFLIAVFTFNSPLFAIMTNSWLKWVFLLAPIGFVLAMALGYQKFSAGTLRALFFTYAAINGVSLSVIGAAYSIGNITSAALVTSLLFGGMSAYGYFTKKDLSSWGSLLMWALIGLIIAMVVNAFVGGTVMSAVISCVAVIVFLALTAYDTQNIRKMLWDGNDSGKETVMGALSLYLNVLNIFLHILNLFGLTDD